MKKVISMPFVKIIAGIVLLVGIAGAWWYVASNRPPSFNATAAARGNVIASLDEPANILAENDVDLSFRAGGQIDAVNVTEGQTVPAGTVLVSLDQSSLKAGLAQANAGLAAAQAKLDELTSGTRPEQLTIDRTAVTNAMASLGADITTAYSAADDAIHNQIDNLFQAPINNNPVFLIPVADSQLLINIQSQRQVVGATLAAWYAATNATSSDQASLSNTAVSALQQVKSYLDMVALAVNNATPNSTLSATVLAGYRTNVVTARNEVGAAIAALTSAVSALQSAKDQLALAEAGATPQDIEVQNAAVAQAQAEVASAQVAVDHANLVAPFSGVVRNLSAKIGQVVAPGAPALSLTNDSGLKIEAYVSEADIAKVKTGAAANVMIDAYGTGTVFPATITTVDSAETIVNGTPAYKVTLHFANSDSRIKGGMTGSVHIITGEHDNVVEVPSRLVVSDGDKNYLLVKNGSVTEKREVQVGLVGDGGMTEIASGVNSGDVLVNF
jgi:RND family efflux transporter MFP subunit